MTVFTRSVALSGASNFRDLGGYAAQGGRLVRWRRLFRSDHLAALTAQDAQALAALGLARAVDLRGQLESAAQSYSLAAVHYHALPIEPTVVQRAKEMAQAGQQMTAPVARHLMEDTYRAFVSDNTPQFAALFAHLLEEDTPLVFHCTAGKDRTGFAAALILRTLGVPEDVVMQDYLLTNGLYRRPQAVQGSAPQEVLDVIWQVQAGFLQAAFDAVERDHGSLARYLTQQLRLDDAARERLAQLYLQPPAGA
ncbi:tyrosine-protein phosphatase [Pulveribacter suum]|uniref:Protein tyrosine phosphatase n=1 Tax=Pulveribacter suum TaxID=2116657 RepID=A0A2P1NID3_9BURK|nr:tyrosine-protein phosphatase [Pulveribacter suum]AVP56796.1 protein tyrosine phosphatase [Pulveribacter suum]